MIILCPPSSQKQVENTIILSLEVTINPLEAKYLNCREILARFNDIVLGQSLQMIIRAIGVEQFTLQNAQHNQQWIYETTFSLDTLSTCLFS